jgi:hypothetical protein
MKRSNKLASIDSWPHIAVGTLIAIAVAAIWFYAVLSAA